MHMLISVDATLELSPPSNHIDFMHHHGANVKYQFLHKYGNCVLSLGIIHTMYELRGGQIK